MTLHLIQPWFYRVVFQILLFVFICQISYAQKVKVKDDVVYVDKKEALRILNIDYQGEHVWILLSPDKDTVARFVSHTMNLPQLPHETSPKKFGYYDIIFDHRDNLSHTYAYNINNEKKITNQLKKAGCFDSGAFNSDCAGRFIQENGDWSESKTSEILQTSAWRENLLKDGEYLKFSSSLPRRNPNLFLEITDDKSIMVFNVKIGNITLKTNGTASWTYSIFDASNKPVGSIFYEISKKRVFIRTFKDNQGKEYFLTKTFDTNDLNNAVTYFIDYGYL